MCDGHLEAAVNGAAKALPYVIYMPSRTIKHRGSKQGARQHELAMILMKKRNKWLGINFSCKNWKSVLCEGYLSLWSTGVPPINLKDKELKECLPLGGTLRCGYIYTQISTYTYICMYIYMKGNVRQREIHTYIYRKTKKERNGLIPLTDSLPKSLQ